MSWFLLSFLISYTMSVSAKNSVSTNKILSLLWHYLQEVAKCQHVLEVFTNNIFASLVSQLQDLQTLTSNPVPTSADIHSLSFSKLSSSANFSILRNLLYYLQSNIYFSIDFVNKYQIGMLFSVPALFISS